MMKRKNDNIDKFLIFLYVLLFIVVGLMVYAIIMAIISGHGGYGHDIVFPNPAFHYMITVL